jgi:HD-GYP domain-containing protein (c-di-GMP phosphodiesterase class II)
VVEAQGPYTGGHLWHISRFSHLLADKAGLPEDEVVRIAVGGFLYDLGKVGIAAG